MSLEDIKLTPSAVKQIKRIHRRLRYGLACLLGR
jgi:hypothetical protein